MAVRVAVDTSSVGVTSLIDSECSCLSFYTASARSGHPRIIFARAFVRANANRPAVARAES
jgi:hypothetical protein